MTTWRRICFAVFGALFTFGLPPCHAAASPSPSAPSVFYSQDRQPEIPWSIHVVRVPRHSAVFEIQSTRESERGPGLATVSEQALVTARDGTPIAAINGDFYQRQGSYSGNPRGLQIMAGELTSAPVGTSTFWIDILGEPHIEATYSRFEVTWPGGTTSPIGLNDARSAKGVVLYTPALGSSTKTKGGRELVLERAGDSPWLPLRAGKSYRARVAEVRNSGNSPLTSQQMVLSLGPGLLASLPSVSVGAELQISMATEPWLRGAKTAISGGPILIRNGKAQRYRSADTDTYETASALERHPRSAVGWNEEYFFLLEVDGRQRRVSVGMTLSELATYLLKLGCTEAMNLDGGGSATLWYAGQVRNRPCDGHERLVANALVVVQKPAKSKTSSPAPASSAELP